ncbi:MAG: hypothetical protein M0Q26_15420 [Chitinophagaceae bacterium]|nr:hypothetical protein [Chitinophagaceae bacterium]
MKPFLIIAASFVLLSSSCRKNKPVNPIDQLPPETQTGANTFGCLVNGEVFKPGGSIFSGSNLACIYQYLISGTPAGYTFALGATNKKDPTNITTVGFGFDSIRMNIGLLLLKVRRNGHGGGQVGFYNDSNPNGDIYSTNDFVTGELNIKKLDTVNQIASGTFWFDAVNANGQKAQIREGRFDVRYTR